MTVGAPRVSIVIPAYNEGDADHRASWTGSSSRCGCRARCWSSWTAEDDTTIPVVEEYAQKEPRLRCLVNTYGRGPANAIRFGIDAAAAPVAVVTMADGCDDARQIDELARLVERGVAVAAASRYMAGGQQVGGPCSRACCPGWPAGRCGCSPTSGRGTPPTRSRRTRPTFVREVGIDSRDGFEIGIELTAKAKRLRRPVAEIPTIWLDRQAGVSNFKVAKWIPSYLRWYRFAFGPRLTAEQIRARAAGPPCTEEG